ncbi:MAG: hypothetical protein HRU11_03505 [Parvularculaceae bacterium]|nr:hypothetical protein [Parvularculaceae bacterium]
MEPYQRFLLISCLIGFTALVLFSLRRFLNGSGPNSQGHLGSHRLFGYAVIGVFCAIAFAQVAAAVIAGSEERTPAMVGWGFGALLTFAFGSLGLVALDQRWNLYWDEQGLEGVSIHYTGDPTNDRHHLKWDEVVAYGSITSTNIYFVVTADNRRIYWSAMFPGHASFLEVIHKYRPEVRNLGEVSR